MLVPKGRGQLSEQLFHSLRDERPLPMIAPEHFDDAQIALWVLYELNYRGFEDVSDQWEWHPEQLHLRRSLEGTRGAVA